MHSCTQRNLSWWAKSVRGSGFDSRKIKILAELVLWYIFNVASTTMLQSFKASVQVTLKKRQRFAPRSQNGVSIQYLAVMWPAAIVDLQQCSNWCNSCRVCPLPSYKFAKEDVAILLILAYFNVQLSKLFILHWNWILFAQSVLWLWWAYSNLAEGYGKPCQDIAVICVCRAKSSTLMWWHCCGKYRHRWALASSALTGWPARYDITTYPSPPPAGPILSENTVFYHAQKHYYYIHLEHFSFN